MPGRQLAAEVPVLVFSSDTRVKRYPFEVSLPEGSGVVGVVLADQLMRLDWRAR